ncbi:riboflavin kinase [Cryobacterium roopkundense]|uniref:Riboflavin biosynthesis protein n=1 Tax=Cryobacterium roopkundense TaxID=1001240 RepID=A0A099JQQ4_9MICO|nr:bifunctional riboflavin kinase/FAD synthetase [Cryobacterium roopkundense]KGJ79763.1 riboflavin kinase [Cryobacterium roopkundense]MBB5640250.1 riboflavin kinase/FMN adenylyltransferase [Cryobacterium roopkundense]
MKTLYGVASVPAEWPASAVCIGKFDGVHAGHRAVIGGLKTLAQEHGLAAVVVTFDRHPLALLAPEACPEALVSTEQKLGLLADTGVDATVVLEFTRALAALPPEEFVDSILVRALRTRFVLVGRDFRFGAGGAGDVDLLRRLGLKFGFDVRLIDDVKPHHDRRVSSTWIRDLLRSGDVQTATDLLGHVPTVRGLVVHGAARGRELGFPTANLAADAEGFTPADGVYAGWLTDAGIRYPAAISVGNNPTFEGIERRQVEAYVLDETDLDLYDHVVDVAFVERIRGMVAYSGIEPLIEQIRDDVQRVRGILTDPQRTV